MTEKNQNAESDQPSDGTIENEKYLNQPSGGMIENEKYLDRALLEYCNSDAYPFHMPGHKRQTMGNWNCEAIDITEITGFDNLHHAEGILLEAQQRADPFTSGQRRPLERMKVFSWSTEVPRDCLRQFVER